jgi:hypothetical protein
MSEAERDAYIRRAMQMVDPSALADRLIARVPGLGGNASEAAEAAEPDQAPAPKAKARPASAELLEDLQLPDDDL